MKNDQLLNQILPILHSVKDNEEKLQQILDFLLNEIYEEPDDTIVIPEKHMKLVNTVAQSIDCGLVCFINPDTLEMEDVPKGMVYDSFDFDEEDDEGSEGENNLNFRKWEKCITVEPPESSESFAIMEGFIGEIRDNNLKKKVIFALGNRKPFANFKDLVETSNYRELWFAFKQKKMEEYVWKNLVNEILPEP
jgi:hypothetical protein